MGNGKMEAAAHPEGGGDDSEYQIATVLSYLWEGQTGSAFEPVEPADTRTAEAAPEQQGARPCLNSTLGRYNSWLASFDRSLTIAANGENSDRGNQE